jgi:hypothetical protein
MNAFAGSGLGKFWVLAVFIVLAAVAALLYGTFNVKQQATDPTPVLRTFAIPPFSESRFLNAQANAQYIGSAACASCHQRNQQSYLRTSHSRSLSEIDPNAEPPDYAFEHKPSGCSYRVYRKDGQIHQEETLKTSDGKVLSHIDLPVRYLIGSGQYCRGYIVEPEGFLHQSPLTWYVSRRKFDMAPGFDAAQHQGFERAIRIRCLACHAGRVEEKEGSVNRFTFHEMAIGCENCHGPGSLHKDLRQGPKLEPGVEDLTIVHPGKLSRPLLESICAVCHQSGPASVDLRGRGVTDYRPGRPLGDYRVQYSFEGGNDQMSVVGHIEQLRESSCYKNSPGLSCVSCHDLHQNEKPKDKIAFYRNKCLACHENKPCKLQPPERLKREPKDDCTACHMPRGNTDIPHVAFSHHRIGLHTPVSEASPGQILELAPSKGVVELEPVDQLRNLGLAYYEVSLNPKYSKFANTYLERARNNLESAYAQGLREGTTAYTLAEIHLKNQDFPRAYKYAEDAIAAKDTPSNGRAVCLLMLADRDRQHRNPAAAIALLEEAIQLRRSADNWRLLGMCYMEQDQPSEALSAFQKALSIRPYTSDSYLSMSQAYKRLGDAARAGEFLEKAHFLEQRK